MDRIFKKWQCLFCCQNADSNGLARSIVCRQSEGWQKRIKSKK